MTRKPLSPWHTLALNNALFAAALHGHLHIVRYLVGDCRADVHAADDGDDLTPFMVAVEHGHLKILQCFRTVHAEDIGVEGIAERPALLNIVSQQGHQGIAGSC